MNNSLQTSFPYFLIYTKYVGSVTTNKTPTFVRPNSTLREYKDAIQQPHPTHTVKRILFGGKLFGANDEAKNLGL